MRREHASTCGGVPYAPTLCTCGADDFNAGYLAAVAMVRRQLNAGASPSELAAYIQAVSA